jgi:hypothetical protein
LREQERPLAHLPTQADTDWANIIFGSVVVHTTSTTYHIF